MKNFSGKSFIENKNTFYVQKSPPPPENRAVYEIIWKIESRRPQISIWSIRIHAGYLSLKTHSQYVILVAFPLQQWLHERASMLHCTCSTLHVLLCLLFSVRLVESVAIIKEDAVAAKINERLWARVYFWYSQTRITV
jgi:hypothetical protein